LVSEVFFIKFSHFPRVYEVAISDGTSRIKY
jgi:hypothetical protein